MIDRMEDFNPHDKTRKILDVAWEYVNSVPYRVGLRWLFYRLFQHGLYQTKEDYHRVFMDLFSKVRKRNYKEWRPDTLADDTTEIIERVGVFQDMKHVEESSASIGKMVRITLDPFYEMDQYVMIGFEARAMVEQFVYYTEGINLVPFGGDAHIEPKWKVAKHLEDAHGWYGGRLKFLYFGDYDNKGNRIFEAAKKDIQRWCEYPIDFEWCGLTREQIERFSLPEDVEAKAPGQYQWEALMDAQAREIIKQAMADSGVNIELIREKIRQGEEITKRYQKKIQKALSKKEVRRC